MNTGIGGYIWCGSKGYPAKYSVGLHGNRGCSDVIRDTKSLFQVVDVLRLGKTNGAKGTVNSNLHAKEEIELAKVFHAIVLGHVGFELIDAEHAGSSNNEVIDIDKNIVGLSIISPSVQAGINL